MNYIKFIVPDANRKMTIPDLEKGPIEQYRTVLLHQALLFNYLMRTYDWAPLHLIAEYGSDLQHLTNVYARTEKSDATAVMVLNQLLQNKPLNISFDRVVELFKSDKGDFDCYNPDLLNLPYLAYLIEANGTFHPTITTNDKAPVTRSINGVTLPTFRIKGNLILTDTSTYFPTYELKPKAVYRFKTLHPGLSNSILPYLLGVDFNDKTMMDMFAILASMAYDLDVNEATYPAVRFYAELYCKLFRYIPHIPYPKAPVNSTSFRYREGVTTLLVMLRQYYRLQINNAAFLSEVIQDTKYSNSYLQEILRAGTVATVGNEAYAALRDSVFGTFDEFSISNLNNILGRTVTGGSYIPLSIGHEAADDVPELPDDLGGTSDADTAADEDQPADEDEGATSDDEVPDVSDLVDDNTGDEPTGDEEYTPDEESPSGDEVPDTGDLEEAESIESTQYVPNLSDKTGVKIELAEKDSLDIYIFRTELKKYLDKWLDNPPPGLDASQQAVIRILRDEWLFTLSVTTVCEILAKNIKLPTFFKLKSK